jgi:hypothetical protein
MDSITIGEKNMKKNILWLGMLAIALVFGMIVIGCDNGNDGGGADPFNGTWKNEAEGLWFVAADGKFTTYSYVWSETEGGEETVDGEMEDLRGTYKVSGKKVNAIVTDVNTFVEETNTYKWVSYASLPPEDKEEYPSSFAGTVSGNTFTVFGMAFKKQ